MIGQIKQKPDLGRSEVSEGILVVKRSALLFLLTVFSLLVVLAAQSAYSQNTGRFRIAAYGTGEYVTMHLYRGYIIRVPRQTEVTHLVGGGSGGTFDIAIYEIDTTRDPDDDNDTPDPEAQHVPTDLLAYATLAENRSEEVHELDDPITLHPGEDYLIAQGRSSGRDRDGDHYVVRQLDPSFLAEHTRIESWYPAEESLRWYPEEDVMGSREAWEIVGEEHYDYRGGELPRIGFYYDTHVEYAEVNTGDAAYDSDDSTLTVKGHVEDTGGIENEDPVFFYFEWGEDEDLSEYGTFVDAEPRQSSSHNTDFTFDIEDAEVGTTYYYRAIAINDKGRQEGEVKSFTPSPRFRLEAGELVTVGGHVGSRSAAILTSSDAVDWDSQESNSRHLLKDVIYDEGEEVLVAVGRWGSIVSSEDGIDWRQETTRAGNHVRGITRGTGPEGEDILVAVGNRGTIMTGTISRSGEDYDIEWDDQDSGTRTTLKSVSYGENTFIAVGTWGRILTSTDGETWQEQDSGEGRNMLKDIVYGDGAWVAVGQYRTLLTSSDGIEWEREDIDISEEHLNCIIYAGGRYVVGGNSGKILTAESGSPDVWEKQPSSTSSDIHDVVGAGLGEAGDPQFVAVGERGLVLTSPDGLNWSQQNSGTTTTLRGITHTEVTPEDESLHIETSGDGTGTQVGPQDLDVGDSLTVYAVLRDQDGVFAGQAEGADFALVDIDGDVEAADLQDHGDGSATFHANEPGSAVIEAAFRDLTAQTGLITVIDDVADPTINVEDDDDGNLVGDLTLDLGDELTVYAVERDADGNYVGLVTDTTWSLDDVSGDVDAGDLEDHEDGTATFNADNIGSAVILAEDPDDVLDPVPSGTITVEDPDDDNDDDPDFTGEPYYQLDGDGLTAHGATDGGASRINYDPAGDPVDDAPDYSGSIQIEWETVNDPGPPGDGFNGDMSVYPTTNAQYAEYLNAALAAGDVVVDDDQVIGADGSAPGSGVFTVQSGFEDHPVTYVSWYGATAFADHYGWRLPTEDEWVAVANYTDGREYATGDSLIDADGNYLANYSDNDSHPYADYGTTPVGHFGTFGYGIADMAGNVWDWTSTVDGIFRVLRGGSWGRQDGHSAMSGRRRFHPDYQGPHRGFRVCL